MCVGAVGLSCVPVPSAVLLGHFIVRQRGCNDVLSPFGGDPRSYRSGMMVEFGCDQHGVLKGVVRDLGQLVRGVEREVSSRVRVHLSQRGILGFVKSQGLRPS